VIYNLNQNYFLSHFSAPHHKIYGVNSKGISISDACLRNGGNAMSFLETAAMRIRNFFENDNDELLFFIIVFLILLGSSTYEDRSIETEERDSGFILFFIVLFLILILSSKDSPLLSRENTEQDDTQPVP